MEPRQAIVSLTYEGKDVSRDIRQYLISLRYAERADSSMTDALNLSLENSHGLWLTEWFPERGAKISATIQAQNWFAQDQHMTLNCGRFEIDKVSSGGPPDTFTIGAVSVGITSSIRGQARTQAWQKMKVSAIGAEIAARNNFEFFFDADHDDQVERREQNWQPDAEFLQSVCEESGLLLKLYDGKLVIYELRKLDSADGIAVLTRGRDGIGSYEFEASSAEVYNACEVKHWDAKKKKLVKSTFVATDSGVRRVPSSAEASKKSEVRIHESTRMIIPSGGKEKKLKSAAQSVGKTLRVKRTCDSVAEAENLARALLRKRNSQEIRGRLEMMGNSFMRAGLNVGVSGFGAWDAGLYSIVEATHNVSRSGYKTSLGLRGVLEY